MSAIPQKSARDAEVFISDVRFGMLDGHFFRRKDDNGLYYALRLYGGSSPRAFFVSENNTISTIVTPDVPREEFVDILVNESLGVPALEWAD